MSFGIEDGEGTELSRRAGPVFMPPSKASVHTVEHVQPFEEGEMTGQQDIFVPCLIQHLGDARIVVLVFWVWGDIGVQRAPTF